VSPSVSGGAHAGLSGTPGGVAGGWPPAVGVAQDAGGGWSVGGSAPSSPLTFSLAVRGVLC
jgi:hypothetical protein